MSGAFSWTFGQGGMYTGTWDGTDTLTVTSTATGAFVESLSGQSLAALLPMAQQSLAQGIGGPAVASALALVADTGMAGYALKTTGTAPFPVLSWTAPPDGNLHTVSWGALLNVTSAETGGNVITSVGGLYSIGNGFSGNQATGYQVAGANTVVPPGATFQILQSVLLTGGAATVQARIWAA